MPAPPSLRPALDAAFARRLDAAAGLDELRGWLCRYRDEGVAAAEMAGYLQALRAAAGEDASHDRLLELLDLATGFCPPPLRVWP
ncbi:hypothetical protein [Lysobacter enzymogenes]|uniref:Uncharacterized protein n=1 Tax=Lysobacter enzymogenes TaxID=69 RepID=A0A3N2RDI0_LYSEN|nr:hypothetical protein [Lysobacter enzymogenes]ROU05469.1 hypothetical protein D9T17_18840 [Lysobacter enzymogenes]